MNPAVSSLAISTEIGRVCVCVRVHMLEFSYYGGRGVGGRESSL